MDRQTNEQTDGQTTDKVIPMCRYASQGTQKPSSSSYKKMKNSLSQLSKFSLLKSLLHSINGQENLFECQRFFKNPQWSFCYNLSGIIDTEMSVY